MSDDYVKERIKEALGDARHLARRLGVVHIKKDRGGTLDAYCPACQTGHHGNSRRRPKFWIREHGFGCWRPGCVYEGKGNSGDSLDLIAISLGLERATDDFPRVLKESAQECGLEHLLEEDPGYQVERRVRTRRSRPQAPTAPVQEVTGEAVLRELWSFIKDQPLSPEAREFLEGRGLDPDIAWKFGVRSNHTSPDGFSQWFHGLSRDAKLSAGLINPDNGDRRFSMLEPMLGAGRGSEGIAVPCSWPGHEHPLGWRLRAFARQGTGKKSESQPNGSRQGRYAGWFGLGALDASPQGQVILLAEGEMDCLAVNEACVRAGLQATVIGTGRAGSLSKDLTWLLEYIGSRPVRVLLHIDKDQSPREARKKLAEGIVELGVDPGQIIPVNVRKITDGEQRDSDINDLLKYEKKTRDTSLLTDWLSSMVEAAREDKEWGHDRSLEGMWRELTSSLSDENDEAQHKERITRPLELGSNEWGLTLQEMRPVSSQHETMEEAREQLVPEILDFLDDEEGPNIAIVAPTTGVGKTYATMTVAALKLNADREQHWVFASPTTTTRDEVTREFEERQPDTNAFSVTKMIGRDRDTCQNFDQYQIRETAKAREGARWCKAECPFRKGCAYLEARQNFSSGGVVTGTHARLGAESEETPPDVLIIDESVEIPNHKLTIAALEEFGKHEHGDIQGHDVLLEAMRLSKQAADEIGEGSRRSRCLPEHQGERLAALVEGIKIPASTEPGQTKAGLAFLEEYEIDTSRSLDATPSWQALEALRDAIANRMKGASIVAGDLIVPGTTNPLLRAAQRAGKTIVLNASLTRDTARATYGDVRWIRPAPKPSAHTYHLHIKTPMLGSEVRNGEFKHHRARLVWSAMRALFGADALYVAHKAWTERAEDCLTFGDDEAYTYHGSTVARGSNAYKDMSVAVVTDYIKPGYVTVARAEQLHNMFAKRYGAQEADQIDWQRHANVDHRQAALEQVVGRIRPLDACEEAPKLLITIGQGEARTFDTVARENVREMNAEQLLWIVYGQARGEHTPKVIGGLLEKAGGLFNEIEEIEEALISCACPRSPKNHLRDIGDLLRTLDMRIPPWLESLSAQRLEDARAVLGDEVHGPHDLAQTISAYLGRGTSANLPSIVIKNSQGGSPRFYVTDPKRIDLDIIDRHARARGWSWYQVPGRERRWLETDPMTQCLVHLDNLVEAGFDVDEVTLTQLQRQFSSRSTGGRRIKEVGGLDVVLHAWKASRKDDPGDMASSVVEASDTAAGDPPQEVESVTRHAPLPESAPSASDHRACYERLELRREYDRQGSQWALFCDLEGMSVSFVKHWPDFTTWKRRRGMYCLIDGVDRVPELLEDLAGWALPKEPSPELPTPARPHPLVQHSPQPVPCREPVVMDPTSGAMRVLWSLQRAPLTHIQRASPGAVSYVLDSSTIAREYPFSHALLWWLERGITEHLPPVFYDVHTFEDFLGRLQLSEFCWCPVLSVELDAGHVLRLARELGYPPAPEALFDERALLTRVRTAFHDAMRMELALEGHNFATFEAAWSLEGDVNRHTTPILWRLPPVEGSVIVGPASVLPGVGLPRGPDLDVR